MRDQRERDGDRESSRDSEEDRDETVAVVNDIYRILKNNEVLGQILKNKYGSLKRQKVTEIIETIADGGLRLVRFIMADQQEINDIAVFVNEQRRALSSNKARKTSNADRRRKAPNIDKMRRAIRGFCFYWTIYNINRIVAALNKPEMRETVSEIVARRNTPAYELIEFFLYLDTIEEDAREEFSVEDYKKLRSVWKSRRFLFFHRVVSLRVQQYLNTHRVRTRMEQQVCSLLGIQYRPRLKRLN